MRFVVLGTNCFAQALEQAGKEASVSLLHGGNIDSAELSLVCGSACEVETWALTLLQTGMDAAVPGWIVGDTERFYRLHQAFKACGRKLILLFPERYSPNVQDVKRILQAGCLGRIGMLEYLYQWPRQCSALLPLAEALDLALYLIGDADKVQGFRSSADEVDCASLSVRFSNGALMNLATVCSPHEDWKTVYEWSGSNGNLTYDSDEARSVRICGEDSVKRRFPMLNTQVCPLRSMLRDLPRVVFTHGPGAAEEDLRLAALICKAFGEEGKGNA